ncbi:hypothetical protein DPMN_095477 [Dreissena polymorpha]|uniref:Uncharacterized protein n=1 Tax=Dreissena polymorpha TaxID=45954 RepID=A0A9D4L9I7_DREPO|nr:hypothetical protein DPMN_095477 [Dreissena polymorpha]
MSDTAVVLLQSPSSRWAIFIGRFGTVPLRPPIVCRPEVIHFQTGDNTSATLPHLPGLGGQSLVNCPMSPYPLLLSVSSTIATRKQTPFHVQQPIWPVSGPVL